MKKTTLLIIGILILNIFLIVADTLDSFYLQTNPFNITFAGGDNQTFYLRTPIYSNFHNVSLNLQSDNLSNLNVFQNQISFINLNNASLIKSLVHVYNFNQDPGTQDLIDQVGNNDSISNPVRGRVTGISNKSWNFDKDFADQVVMGDSLIGGFKNLTINCWANTTQVNTDPAIVQTVLGTAEGGFNTRIILIDGTVDYRFQLHTDVTDATFQVLNTNIRPNNWYMLTMVYNGSHVRGYVNASQNNTIAISGTVGATLPLRIGADGTGGNTFNGTIDECYIWKRALTPNEVKILYNESSGSFYPYQEEEFGGLLNDNISLDISFMNQILENDCVCDGCIVDGDECQVPVFYYSDLASNLTVNLSNSTVFTNLTFRIFDRERNELITDLVQLQIKDFDNFSTTTGLININFTIDPGPYNAIAQSDKYVTEQRDFTLTDRASTTIDFYLLNQTLDTGANLIAQIFDDFYNNIVGANVKLLEYKPDSDSFVEVSQCFSDTNGQCVFSIELNTKFYIIQATFVQEGNVFFAQSTETGQLIKLDQTIIELHLSTSEAFELGDMFNLIIIPSNTTLVDNTTSFLTATFNDIQNNNHSVCVGYYIQQNINEIFLNQTCINGSAGIVNYADGYILNRNFTYIAKIFTRDNNTINIYNKYVYPALEGSMLSEFGFYLKPFIFFLLLSILAVSLYMKNILIFAYGTIPLSLLTAVWHPTLLGGITITIIIVMCITIIYMARKKTEAFS